jgi:hypothetical protein
MEKTKRLRIKQAVGLVGLAVMGAMLASVVRADSGWMPPFTDGLGDVNCPTSQRIEATHCTGRYCDNIELYCGSVSSPYGPIELEIYFSDEADAATCSFSPENDPNNWLVLTGMGCTGDYCDNMHIICRRPASGSTLSSCAWTPWVSEEGGGYNLFWDKSARAAQCSGDYCDAMRYLVCDQTPS